MVPEQSQVRVLSQPAPKEKKSRKTSYNSLFQHHPCWRAALLPRGAQQRQGRVSAEGGRDVGTSSTTQQANKQGKKVGFGASRVQGIPKAARAVLVPRWLLPVSHPKEGLSREQLPLPSSLHVLCSHTRTSARVHPAGTLPPPCASSWGGPGLHNPHR